MTSALNSRNIKNLLFAVALALACGGAFAGRGSVALVNYEDVPVPVIPDETLTLEQVKKAIHAALAVRQWSVNLEEDNKILASHTRGQYMASVRITYSAKAFSIQYIDSRNFKYSPAEGGRVHPNYNNWVTNLKTDIEDILRRRPPSGAS